jgi:hypothetical protein
MPPSVSPLADMAQVRSLIQGLAGVDAHSVLAQVSAWLRTLTGLEDLPFAHRLEVIDLLDRLAKNHQFSLVPDYLQTERMRKLTESQLWQSSFGFWHALGDAYLDALERFQAMPQPPATDRTQLPWVTGRILRILGLQLKWTWLRYAPVPQRLWRDLGRTYLLAEGWGFAARRCALYPGKQGGSSPQEELLRPLMLAMASPDALTPRQQHVAERLSAYLCGRFALHTTPGPGCSCVFDLSLHQPPSRARKAVLSTPPQRFFGVGTAHDVLQRLQTQWQQQHRLPPDIGVGEQYPPQDVGHVLDHLLRCWADEAPSRRRVRTPVMQRLTVVPGWPAAWRWLHEGDAALWASEAPLAAESWVVSDASDAGCGAVVPAFGTDWLEVGALLAVRPERDTTPRMAIVRRIAAEADGQHRVGLEFLGDQALGVSLWAPPPVHEPDAAPSGEGTPAVVLQQRPDARGRIELLLRSAVAWGRGVRRFRLGEQWWSLVFEETLEEGAGFRRVQARLLS